MTRNLLFTLLVSLISWSATAQVVSTKPIFPTVDDTVTIIFNAAEGNGALAGINQVYAHTGVITNNSTSLTDWKYVQGQWGTADPNVEMTNLGNDRHSIRYHIRSFYGVPATDSVEQLSFVFRNTDGSIVGRSADASDIYYPIFDNSLHAKIVSPTTSPAFYTIGESIQIHGAASKSATLTLSENGTQLAQTTGDSIGYLLTVSNTGRNTIVLEVDDGTLTVTDTFVYIVNAPANVAALPAGIEDGINYTSDTSVVLSLFAPDKNFVYVIGDFNNWEVDPTYRMNVTPSGDRYWLEIEGLTPQEEYAYQYMIDGNLTVGDPYCDKILDPWNDQFIDDETYPNLKPYPTGKATGIVSVLQTAQQPYQWATNNFQKPAKTDLVVYELLVRDFVASHNYATLIDTLDYLQNMGINCIELMPIMEFEANISWGYNPSYFFAVDKYYGTKNELKRFIDTCHSRGIAVVLDMVLNHSFGQGPMVRMYWDAANNQPAANSPWFNQQPTHDFNVGYDFNHESPATEEFSKRVLRYWLEEYRFDGYRMDLSKGFTQKNTLGNVGLWGQYDASRVAILKDYADEVWSVDPDAYFILEHFADNSEETELANYGMMLWGNIHGSYKQIGLGYVNSSNVDWAYHGTRGWNDPHVVAYMESHDEERQVYEIFQYGNSSGGYNVKDFNTGLDRINLASTLFYTIPGPKMLWQFGEMGYDFSINYNGRTGPKPIRWNYLEIPARLKIYKTKKALIELRNGYEVFKNGSVELSLAGRVKRIKLGHNTMNVVVLGNMDVTAQDGDPSFHNTGWWYEYFTGDSINVTNVNAPLTLEPGEYRIYTTEKLPVPDTYAPVGLEDDVTVVLNTSSMSVSPNPANTQATILLEMDQPREVMVEVIAPSGQRIAMPLSPQVLPAGTTDISWDLLSEGGWPVANGQYWVVLRGEGWSRSAALMVVR